MNPFISLSGTSCLNKKVRSDRKRILPTEHDLKEWPDAEEGGETKENPVAEETTDPSY